MKYPFQILSFLLFCSMVLTSCSPNEVAKKDESYSLEITKNDNLSINEGYELSLSQNIKIHTGGAFVDKKLNEIQDGTSVGGVSITKEQVKKIEESIGQMWLLEINKYGTLNHREMVLTNLNTKEKTKGLFNVDNRIFLSGNAATESYNNGKCGTIGLGLIKGKIAADGSSVSEGEISFTILTACEPLIVGINITFFYTAKRIGSGTGIPFVGSSDSWNVPQNSKLLTEKLVANRWQFNFYANNGNVLKPVANDFIQFYANGDMDIVLLGLYDKAKWKYNESTKALEITNSSGAVSHYFVQNLSDKTFQVYTPNDEYRYEAIVKPTVEMPANATANTKLLSSTRWKTQTLKAGILTPTPKASDFVYFYPDGSYEQSVLGFYAKGTWKWENSEKRISLITSAGNMARNIVLLTDKKLELLENNEGGTFLR